MSKSCCRTLGLALLVLSCMATTQVMAQQSLPAGIIDEGFPDFRQLVDVNNDQVSDYCRFVGTTPNIFLSCQLGAKNGGFQAAPYAFNAPIGTDLGIAPRLIFPIGRMGFCRYIAKRPAVVNEVGTPAVVPSAMGVAASAHSNGPILHLDPLPALDPTKVLLCIEAGKNGFDATKEINPSDSGVFGRKVALVKGPDGATIELVFGGTLRSWIASVQDATGRHWHLSGSATLSNTGSGYITYLKLYSDEDDSGRPFSAKFLQKYPRANIVLDQFFQLTKQGYVSYSITGKQKLDINQPNGILSTGYTVTRSGATKGSLVFVWDGCSPADPNSPSTPYAGTLNSDGTIGWKGPQPPTLAGCTPSSDKLAYFADTLKVLGSKTHKVLRTGNPAIDNKDVMNLSNSDIDAIVNSLEAEIAQTKTADRQKLLDVVTTLRIIQGGIIAVGTSVFGNGISAIVTGGLVASGAGELLAVGAGIAVIGGFIGEEIVETVKLGQYHDCVEALARNGESTSECKKTFMEGP
jgi:uncharacterized protein YcfJ